MPPHVSFQLYFTQNTNFLKEDSEIHGRKKLRSPKTTLLKPGLNRVQSLVNLGKTCVVNVLEKLETEDMLALTWQW